MLRGVLLAGSFALLSPELTLAQSQEGHVYGVASFKAHTGQEGEYSQAYRDWM